MASRTSVALLLCSIAAAGHAQSLVDRPIGVRNTRAINLVFLRLPGDFPVLDRGKLQLTLGAEISNDFRAINLLREDAETLRLSIFAAKGMGRDWTAFAEVPILFRGGGFLDPIIDWWHENVLRWSNPQRDSAPFGNSIVGSGSQYKFGSAGGYGDISLGASKKINGSVSFLGAIKLPTGSASRLLGSGNLDFAAGLKGRISINSKWSLHAMLGMVLQGAASELPNTRTLVDQEMIALVYHPNSRDAWLAQWQSESSAIRTGERGADAAQRILTFAYRRKISNSQELELYFSEDRDVFNGRWPEGANIGADFSAGLRFTWRW